MFDVLHDPWTYGIELLYSFFGKFFGIIRFHINNLLLIITLYTLDSIMSHRPFLIVKKKLGYKFQKTWSIEICCCEYLASNLYTF
jgi:hypothetical protein